MARKRKRASKQDEKTSNAKRVKLEPGDATTTYPLLSLYYSRVSTLRAYIQSGRQRPSRSRRQRLKSVPEWHDNQETNCSHLSDCTSPKEGICETVHHGKEDLSRLLDTTIVGHGLVALEGSPSNPYKADVEVLSQKLHSSLQSTAGHRNVTQREVCMLSSPLLLPPFFVKTVDTESTLF